MPQIVRFGCAGVAVIIIAALTSVGLYAVLTGGPPFGGPAPKPITGGAQVLVTIQAGQPTPTPPSASTPTPTGGAAASSLASVLAAPVAAASAPPPAAAPTPTATVAPLQTPVPVSAPGGPAPKPATSPVSAGSSGATPSQGEGATRPAHHEGLSAEIVEVERGWQPTDAAGAPISIRDGHELVTVQIRLMNGAAEARYVSESDLVLVSDAGDRFAPKQAAPQREPRLLTMPLLPGDTVRGWLTYETPAGQVTRRVQWSPTRPDRPRAETAFNLTLPR